MARSSPPRPTRTTRKSKVALTRERERRRWDHLRRLRVLAALLLLAAGAAAQDAPARGYELLDPGEVVVEHMPHASAGLAGRMAELHARSKEAVEEGLGLPVPPRPRVVLAPDDAELLRRYVELAGGGAPPAGAVAIAFPGRGVVLVRQGALEDPDELAATYRHELVHLALGPLQARRRERLPRWLEEGLAELVSGRRPDAGERSTLGNWARAGTLPRLRELAEAFPPHAPAGARAYLISVSFLSWVDRQQGGGGARRLVAALERGASLDAAFVAATGDEQVDAELAWRDALAREEPWWTAFLFRVDVWSITAFLALLAILRHWYRTRRLRAELARQDEEEDAAARGLTPPEDPPSLSL